MAAAPPRADQVPMRALSNAHERGPIPTTCKLVSSCVLTLFLGPLACGDSSDTAGQAADGGTEPTGERPGLRVETLGLPAAHVYATDFAFVPGSQELLLLQKDGLVTHYRVASPELERLGEFQLTGLRDDSDCGLISLAFDPNFSDNGLVYFGLCTSDQESGVFRYRFDPGDYAAIDGTRTPILLAREPAADRAWHNVGALDFDAEGYLWVGLGDKTVSDNAADPGNVLGTVVRVVPNRDPDGSGHEPAPGNPYLEGGGDPDVYAYGVRSPWRLAIDAAGRAWVGDVGLDDVEEINVVDRPGLNFGWPHVEGPCEEDCQARVDPTLYWSHSDEEHPHLLDDLEANPTTLRVAWVGTAYQAQRQDRYDGLLSGGMLFGDSCLGNLRVATLSATGELRADEPLGHLGRGTLAVRQGGDDYLYGLTMGACVTTGDVPPVAGFFRLLPGGQ